MKDEMKRQSKRRAAEAEPSRDVMMRRAAEREAEAVERRRRRRRKRILGWSIAIPAIGALVALFVVASNIAGRAHEETRLAIANTKINYQSGSEEALLGRVDGSYYSVSEDEFGIRSYTYSTTAENGNVATYTVSTEVDEGNFLWIPIRVSVDVNVRVITDDDTESEPRVTFERCNLEPIDPSEPSYEGDPHTDSFYELGTGRSLDVMTQLCKDRITFWVPDGTLQPE